MRDFIATLHKRNASLLWTGFLMLISAVVSLGLLAFDRTATLRNNSWFDVFFYSFYSSITLFSMGWLLSIINVKNRRSIYSLLLIILSTSAILVQWLFCADVRVKTMMAQTPQTQLLNSIIIWTFWAFCILMLALTIQLFLQRKVPYSQHYSWGIRMGVCLFSVSLMLIGAIICLLQSGSLSTNNGIGAQTDVLIFDGLSFKIPFYFAAHALQIIPITSYYLFEKKRQVVLFSITYVISFLVFLIIAMLR